MIYAKIYHTTTKQPLGVVIHDGPMETVSSAIMNSIAAYEGPLPEQLVLDVECQVLPTEQEEIYRLLTGQLLTGDMLIQTRQEV